MLNSLQKKYIIYTLAVTGLMIASALSLQSDHPDAQNIFLRLFWQQELPGGILHAIILLGALGLARKTSPSTIETLVTRIGDHPFKVAFLSFIILCLATLFVYHDHPLSMDEYMAHFQAKVFAEGELWGEYPPDLVQWLVPKRFENHFTIVSHQTGKVVSGYWPGFALLLAPFMKIGAPWMLNPLLAAGSLLLLVCLAKKMIPHPEAPGWIVLLTLASPAFTINAISYYSMNAHLFFNLLYAFLLMEQTVLRLVAAGLVGSFALVLHNPVPHILFAVPWLIWLLKKENRLRNVGFLFLGYIPFSLLLGFGWVWLKMYILAEGRASIAQQQISVVPGGTDAPIGEFIKRVDFERLRILLRSPYDMLRGVLQVPDMNFLWVRLLGFLKVFAWAVPGLPFLAILDVRHIKEYPGLRLWGWAAVCTLIGYMFIPASQGHGWGYRYFHSAWVALPLLATVLLVTLNTEGKDLKNYVGVVTILSLFFCTPLRFFQVERFVDRHLKQRPPLGKVSSDKRLICFIDPAPLNGYYKADLIMNDPFLRDPVIFFAGRGIDKDREMVRKRFPNARLLGLYNFDSVWEVDKNAIRKDE